MLTEKCAPPFFQFLLSLVLTQNKLSLCRALIFCFVLFHTKVRLPRNQYMIIYTMKKHHGT